MPVTVGWDDAEHRILVYTFERMWTWREFYEAQKQGDQWMYDKGTPSDVAYVAPPGVQIPEGFIPNVSCIAQHRYPLARLVVIVTTSKLALALFSVVAKVFPKEFQVVKFVATLDEARALLREYTGEPLP